MFDTEKLTLLKAMTGESEDTVLSAYLSIAGNKILNKLYPFGSPSDEIPQRYEYTQLEIAAYLLNKRGAEGETAHGENGISRTYGSADVPADLLREVVPMAAVVGGA